MRKTIANFIIIFITIIVWYYCIENIINNEIIDIKKIIILELDRQTLLFHDVIGLIFFLYVNINSYDAPEYIIRDKNVFLSQIIKNVFLSTIYAVIVSIIILISCIINSKNIISFFMVCHVMMRLFLFNSMIASIFLCICNFFDKLIAIIIVFSLDFLLLTSWITINLMFNSTNGLIIVDSILCQGIIIFIINILSYLKLKYMEYY